MGEQIVCHDEINLGVAVALDQGLIVPVVRAADKKSIQEINRTLQDLAERARADQLSVDEVTGGTFTVTNLGMYRVDAFTPIVNPPEVAILGAGAVSQHLALVRRPDRGAIQDDAQPDHRSSCRGWSAGRSLSADPRGTAGASCVDLCRGKGLDYGGCTRPYRDRCGLRRLCRSDAGSAVGRQGNSHRGSPLWRQLHEHGLHPIQGAYARGRT